MVITWDQVAAFRLKRHHLIEQAPADALLSVAGDMAGVQAQLLSAAQISLHSRIRDLQIAQIDGALRERTLVKATCMRQTLFLVPSERLAAFVRGSARRHEKEIRWTRGKGVPEVVIDSTIEAALEVLDKPLTRQEIAEGVSRRLGVQKQDVHGGGWGSRRKVAAVSVGELVFPVVDLLHLVSARGVICYGPSRENEPTFIRADAWITGWKDIPVEQAEDQLLRTYLGAFGPATPADFARWTGMTLADARQIWRRTRSGLAQVDVAGWTAEVLWEDLDELAEAHFERPSIRLLPYFDAFHLGHRVRDHLVPVEHQVRVYRPQGWIAPVVLVDGRVVGVWEYAQMRDNLRVKVSTFRPVTSRIAAGISEEAQDLGRFLGASRVEIHIS